VSRTAYDCAGRTSEHSIHTGKNSAAVPPPPVSTSKHPTVLAFRFQISGSLISEHIIEIFAVANNTYIHPEYRRPRCPHGDIAPALSNCVMRVEKKRARLIGHQRLLGPRSGDMNEQSTPAKDEIHKYKHHLMYVCMYVPRHHAEMYACRRSPPWSKQQFLRQHPGEKLRGDWGITEISTSFDSCLGKEGDARLGKAR
jgi:hypothetical protein